jgi:hypothetical protein
MAISQNTLPFQSVAKIRPPPLLQIEKKIVSGTPGWSRSSCRSSADVVLPVIGHRHLGDRIRNDDDPWLVIVVITLDVDVREEPSFVAGKTRTINAFGDRVSDFDVTSDGRIVTLSTLDDVPPPLKVVLNWRGLLGDE